LGSLRARLQVDPHGDEIEEFAIDSERVAQDALLAEPPSAGERDGGDVVGANLEVELGENRVRAPPMPSRQKSRRTDIPSSQRWRRRIRGLAAMFALATTSSPSRPTM